MDSIPPLASFRRVSVADQAYAVLRRAIQQGTFSDTIPGEHNLARHLGISRSSLRTAMAQLAAEGFIERANGVRARVRPQQRARGHSSPPVVCVVCPITRELLLRTQHPVVMEMHVLFATKGIGWEEAFDAKLDVPRPERQLQALVAGRRHVCWLLMACPAPIQRWFAQASVPALVVGSCVPGVNLPSVDTDYRALGWHAAGSMIKHGHRHIALMQHRQLLAGDMNTFEGVRSYVAKTAPATTVSQILIDSDFSNLRARLTQALSVRQRPTALFCVRSTATVGSLVHLLRLGFRVPDDIALVSRDSHVLLDTVLPDITRYSDVSLRQAKRTVRLAQALLAGQTLPPRPSLVMPSFIRGETLGPAPDKLKSGRPPD